MTCPWAQSHPLLEEYHNREWGTPVHEDVLHFEFFTMDLFQAGLSWLTILKKREGFRQAFDGFDFHKVAGYGERKVEALLSDKSIIRNQLKIRATIHNARMFRALASEYGSFDSYIWQFTEGTTIHHAFTREEQLPPSTELSDKMSKDLKGRGFKFVGTTIVYAYMQAAGMVNDHLVSCPRYEEIKKLSNPR